MEQIELEVKTRDEANKKARNKYRNDKFIPAVLYGNNENNLNIMVSNSRFCKIIDSHENEHIVLPIKISDNNDKVIETKTVMIKEIQRNPITDRIVHIDFQSVDITKKVHTTIPVVTKGKPKGVKEGGLLEFLAHNVDVECLPLDIPEHITIDITDLNLGESYHVRDIPSDDKIKILSSPDTTIVTVISAQKAAAEETKPGEEPAKPAEPELIGKKGKEETEEK